MTTKNGDTYTGIFAGSTMDNHECGYLFKMVQAIDTKSGLNGDRSTVADYIGVGEDHAMSFDAKDVGSLVLAKFALNPREKPQNGTYNSLKIGSPCTKEPYKDLSLASGPILISLGTLLYVNETFSAGNLPQTRMSICLWNLLAVPGINSKPTSSALG